MKKEHYILSAMMGVFALVGLSIGLYFNASNNETVQATSTDRNDSGIILTTGEVFVRTGSGMEGVSGNYSALDAVYALDQNTGQLTAGVVAREGQSFQGIYAANVNQGLAAVMSTGGDETPFPQRPRYTMVTGQVTIPKQAGAKWQVPQAVLYVHEQTTGYLMVYTLPWDAANYNSGGSQQGQMVLWTAYRFTAPYGE